MKFQSIIISFFLFLSFSMLAQQKKDTAQAKRKIFFGGGIQLGVSNAYTSFGISPSVIYEFSDQFSSGLGVSYTYSNNKLYDLKYQVVGLSALALYNPLEPLQLSTEFEEMHISVTGNSSLDPYWIPAWYMGIAYSMRRHAAFGFRYDVLYDKDKSVYDSPFTPFIRIYF